ncbi:MAG: Fluoride ion transporter CrcB, partial [uncultured Chloroflexia bacterium]
ENSYLAAAWRGFRHRLPVRAFHLDQRAHYAAGVSLRSPDHQRVRQLSDRTAGGALRHAGACIAPCARGVAHGCARRLHHLFELFTRDLGPAARGAGRARGAERRRQRSARPGSRVGRDKGRPIHRI